MTNNFGVVGIVETAPELRESASGKVFCIFSLSVQPWAKGAVDRPATVLYKITSFGSLAIHVGSTVKKRDRLVVIGDFEVEHWKAKDGSERTTNKILAEGIGLDMRFASPKRTREMSVAHT